MNALITDLQNELKRFPCIRPLESIFIGGGTPSLFSANAFDKLLQNVKNCIPFTNNIEITLEANPGTVEQNRFQEYRSLGINRLSLGIQSFHPKHLQALGRIHDGKEAHLAIESARRAGFDNINLDIMHGLPSQTIAEGLQDLKDALSYSPEHLSWYQLTLEPNTVFYKQRPNLPNEDDSFALEEAGFALLQENQLNRYEISAFATQNQEARHNLNYWLFGDYYGIGAGAHGKITISDAEGLQIVRTRKNRMPAEYLRKNTPASIENDALSSDDLIFEFMLNATRLEQPIPNRLFSERTGLPFLHLAKGLQAAVTQGFIHQTTNSWQITPFGRRFTNVLQTLFLP